MSFALRLKYSVNEGDLIIKPDNVELLGRRDAWRDDITNTTRLLCELGDVGTLAVYFTGLLMQKKWRWIDVSAYSGNNAMLVVNTPEQQREEFMRLVKTKSIKRSINRSMMDVRGVLGEEWHGLERIYQEQLLEFAKSLEEIEITELSLIPETEELAEVEEMRGEAIQVLKDDDEFELNEEALKGILLHPDIGDRPIAVISIAGPFREGKSFMMNFFLRYLRREGYEPRNNQTWTGPPESLLENGFAFRGGIDPHTSGIVFWSEPFIVKRGEEEIAVLLADTQGEFDGKSSKKRSNNILAINVLLSSTVIYNVQQKIPTNVLESLEFCVMCAKEARECGSDIATEGLLFLVRDWVYFSQYPHGLEGGQSYLGVRDSESATKVNIREGFAKVECYLMPEPGEKIKDLREKREVGTHIKMKDVGTEFLYHVSNLTNHLLLPENLVPKPMNGQGLFDFTMKCYDNIKEGGKLPDSHTLVQSALEVRIGSIILETITKFDTAMTLALAGDHVPWAQFENLLKAEEEKALECYKGKVTFGKENFRRKHEEQFRERIEIWSKKFKKTNLLYERKSKAESGDIVSYCFWDFSSKMEEVELELPTVDHEQWLDEKYRKLMLETLHLFRRKISTSVSEEDREKQEEILSGEMKDSYELIKKKYSSRKERLEHTYRKLALESLDIYEEKMSEGLTGASQSLESIKRLHKSANKQALRHFDEKKKRPSALSDPFRTILRKNIERRNNIYGQELETKQMKNAKLEQMHRDYDTFIGEKTEGKAVSPERLKEIGRTFSTSTSGQMATGDLGVHNWSQEVAKALERNDQMNYKKKERADMMLFALRENLIDAVILKAEETVGEYEDPDALERKLANSKQTQMEQFKNSINQNYRYEDDFSASSLQRLEDVVDSVSAIQVRRCRRYQPMIQCQQDIQQLNIQLKYIEAMAKVLDGKWVSEEELALLHTGLVEILVPDTFCEQENPHLKRAENQCKETLEDLYKDFKIINVRNMPFYRRFRRKLPENISDRSVMIQRLYSGIGAATGLPIFYVASGLLHVYHSKRLQKYVDERSEKLRQRGESLKAELQKLIPKFSSHENQP